MAQHDYDLVNAPTLTVRSELNSILAAVLTSNSGPLPPVENYKGQLWFNNDLGTLNLQNSAGTAWTGIPVDVDFLPVTGGTVAALTVQGTFSNPDYDRMRGSYAGGAAPTNSLEGQFWYDTTAPATLKIKKGTAWITAIDIATPTFTDAMTISASSTGNAHIILKSQGIIRYIYNEHGQDRINFYLPAQANNGQANNAAFLSAAIRDDGELYLGKIGWLHGLIDAKQQALGFTPIRQTGSTTVMIGYSSPHIWLNNGAGWVDQGEILFGPQPVGLLEQGTIGSLTWARPLAAVGVNGTIDGASMSYVYDTSHPVGTWRNLQGALTTSLNGIFQRIA